MLLIALGICLLFAGIVFPSNKYVTAIILLYMFVLFGFNTLNADYLNYTHIYDGITNGRADLISRYEIGYVFLCKLFGGVFHLPYQGFVIFIAALSIVLIICVLYLYDINKYQNVFLFFFIVTQYTVMICQYRFYIGMLFALIGLYFYIWKNGVIYKFMAIGFILLGFLFHSAIILFSVLLLAKHLNIKKCVAILFLLIALFSCIRIGLFADIISEFVPEYKIENWIYSSTDRSVIGIVVIIIVRVSLVIVEYYVYHNEKKHFLIVNTENINEIRNYLFSLNTILKVSILSLSFVYFEIFTKHYERIARLSLFMFGLFLVYYMKKHQSRRLFRRPLSYIIMTSYVVLFIITYYVSFHEWTDGNLIPVLTNNLLLQS